MKTATYASVLTKASEYTGRPYAQLTTEEATMFRGFMSTALRKIWEKFPWPETLATEKVYFAEILDPQDLPTNSTVTLGKCYYWPTDGKYYTVGYYYGSLLIDENYMPTDTDGTAWTVDSNQTGFWYESGAAPTEDWDGYTALEAGDVVTYLGDDTVRFRSNEVGLSAEEIATFDILNATVVPFVRDIDKAIDFDGTVRTSEIGEVYSVTREDPRIESGLTPVKYALIGDTIRVKEALPYVWIEYRTVPPALLTDPSTIPYRFSEYVAQMAASMMCLVDGKADLGATWAGLAESTLMDECDKVRCQEGQVERIQVSTR